MLASVEANGAVGKFENHMRLTSNSAPAFSHQSHTLTVQNDTGHGIAQKTSTWSWLTMSVLNSSSDMPRTSSLVERAQGTLSVLIFNLGDVSNYTAEWSMDTFMKVSVLLGTFIWIVLSFTYCLAFTYDYFFPSEDIGSTSNELGQAATRG